MIGWLKRQWIMMQIRMLQAQIDEINHVIWNIPAVDLNRMLVARRDAYFYEIRLLRSKL